MMIYSHTPPARVPLRATASGQDARTLTDWPLGWTHFIDADITDPESRRNGLYAYRLAILAVEYLTPEATSHLEHLRTMRAIYADSVAWGACSNLYRTLSLRQNSDGGRVSDSAGLPMHGPVAEWIDSYEVRAERLRADARALMARAERIDERVADIKRSMKPVRYADGCYLVDEFAAERIDGSWDSAVVAGPFATYGAAVRAATDINIGDDCNVYDSEVLNGWIDAGHITHNSEV